LPLTHGRSIGLSDCHLIKFSFAQAT
jgi:hypothetical protein